MGLTETFKLDLYPEYTATFCLFDEVTNISTLRQKVMKKEIDCALINVDYVTGVFPVLLACNKAVYAKTNKSMKTRSLHTEVLYNLSPSNSITDSLKTFGAADSQKAVICLCLRKEEEGETGAQAIFNMVEGTAKALSCLESFVNVEKCKNIYKITDGESDIGTLEDSIVMRISTKDVL